MSDIGGAVQLWDLIGLLGVVPTTPVPAVIHPGLGPAVYNSFMLEEWRTPEAVSDDYPNTVFDVAVHLADTGGGPEPDEVHVYVAVARVAIEVLRFEPSGSPAYLVPLDHIETPSGSGGLCIWQSEDGTEQALLFAERNCGVRGFQRP